MKQLKTFWYVFTNSLTSTNYYNDLIKVPLSFTLKYYFFLSFILTLVLGATLSLRTSPQIITTANKALQSAINKYDDDLVITAQNGSLSVNKPEPYIVSFSDDLQNEMAQEGGPQNLIVFDSDGTLDDLERYNTFALVNSKNIIFNNDGEIRAYPTQEIQNGSFEKADLLAMVAQIRPYLDYTYVGMFIAGIIGFGFYYLIRLMYAYVFGLFIMVAGKFKDLPLKYEKYVQIAVHTFTPLMLIEAGLHIADYELQVPFWLFGLHLIIALGVIYKMNGAAGGTEQTS